MRGTVIKNLWDVKEPTGHVLPGVVVYLTFTLIFWDINSFITYKLHLNPFAPGNFAEKRVLKLVEWFSGHCRAIKS